MPGKKRLKKTKRKLEESEPKCAYDVYIKHSYKRTEMDGTWVRLSDKWLLREYQGDQILYHTVESERDKVPTRISTGYIMRYMIYDKQNWHVAGTVYTSWRNDTRKRCVSCNRKIPEQIRFLFKVMR